MTSYLRLPNYIIFLDIYFFPEYRKYFFFRPVHICIRFQHLQKFFEQRTHRHTIAEWQSRTPKYKQIIAAFKIIYSKYSFLVIIPFNPFMQNVKKWSSILQKIWRCNHSRLIFSADF